MRFKEFSDLDVLTNVLIPTSENAFEWLFEGRWLKGSFKGSIRIDPANYGAGQMHAHVYGRKREEIGVVNLDGSASHGTKCRLSQDVADALREKGFNVPPSNIVEWVKLEQQPELLLEG